MYSTQAYHTITTNTVINKVSAYEINLLQHLEVESVDIFLIQLTNTIDKNTAALLFIISIISFNHCSPQACVVIILVDCYVSKPGHHMRDVKSRYNIGQIGSK